LAGFVVREHSRTQSNFRAEQSLSEYLQQWGIVAIESIDTRALVRRLRSGVLSTIDLDDASLVAKARSSPGLVGRDLVREVLPDQPFEWHQPLSAWTHLRGVAGGGGGGPPARGGAPGPPPEAPGGFF
jgi:carbamoyl-phosphate synthase small subunit